MAVLCLGENGQESDREAAAHGQYENRTNEALYFRFGCILHDERSEFSRLRMFPWMF